MGFSCFLVGAGTEERNENVEEAELANLLADRGLSQDNCGLKNTNRIVNGNAASQNEWPWQVYLPNPGCGGTIIHPRFILTAAHCLYWCPDCRRLTEDEMHVVVGDHNKDQECWMRSLNILIP